MNLSIEEIAKETRGKEISDIIEILNEELHSRYEKAASIEEEIEFLQNELKELQNHGNNL